MKRLLPFVLVITLLPYLTGVAHAQSQRKDRTYKTKPDLAEVKYGPNARNVLDLWKAKSETPTPLVVYIHGGGFHRGSKETIHPDLIEGCLANGISVMSINYRLSPQVSFPAHFMDSARAIQFARSRAKEWNIDPNRIGATGGSAGAGTSLWIGFHDNMADPKNSDPVLRESTRLRCIAVGGAQTSYDPRDIKVWVGEAAAKHPVLATFYGLKAEEMDTPKAHKLYEAASAINLLTKDDPPVIAFYKETDPVTAETPAGVGIHHINFGRKLKEKMDPLGVECIIREQGNGTRIADDSVKFFVKHLK